MDRRLFGFLLFFLFCIAVPGALCEAPTPPPTPTRNPNAARYDPEQPHLLKEDQIVAHSFILLERSRGEVLLHRNESDLMFPASTTKIMTALVALMYGELDDVFVISESAVDVPEGSSLVPFRAGEEVTLRDALYGLILRSGNEAANAIAEYIAGSVPAFVQLMNEQAYLLGCQNTHFTNPHGLHDEIHYTTAVDLAIMMDEALNHPELREILSATSYILQTNRGPARTIRTTNQHMDRSNADRFYPPVFAGKTGYHAAADYTLVEAAERNGIELIAVVLKTGLYSRWPDTSWLFEYGFTRFKSVTPEQIYMGIDPHQLMEQSRRQSWAEREANAALLAAEAGEPEESFEEEELFTIEDLIGDLDPEDGEGMGDEPDGEPGEDEPLYSASDLAGFDPASTPAPTPRPTADPRIEIEIKGFDLADPDKGRLRLDIQSVNPGRDVRITGATAEIDAIIDNFSAYTNLRWVSELRAPIEKGQVMGILTFFPDGEEPADYELVADRAIPARENAPPTLEEIERRVLEDPSIWPPFHWHWVLPPALWGLGILTALRYLIRFTFKQRRSRKRIPKPQKRYFS